ncbi:MAG: PIN domain-containing protein [Gemmatimonadetes bacterium]|nr:PIN domain-containing protein [Gemmatimonadota bacterium]
MIYLDTSVALAHLMAEDRRPPESIWNEPLISSRLLEYEVWNRLHSRGLGSSHRAAAEVLLGRLAFVEFLRPVLTRATEAFPAPVRTLDGLHLASMDFLVRQGQRIRLASYDQRLNTAALKAGIELHPLQ